MKEFNPLNCSLTYKAFLWNISRQFSSISTDVERSETNRYYKSDHNYSHKWCNVLLIYKVQNVLFILSYLFPLIYSNFAYTRPHVGKYLLLTEQSVLILTMWNQEDWRGNNNHRQMKRHILNCKASTVLLVRSFMLLWLFYLHIKQIQRKQKSIKQAFFPLEHLS